MDKQMRIALLAITLAITLSSPALAADQQTVSSTTPTATFAGKFGSGFVYGSSVSTQVPKCTPGVYDCESTLVRADDYGRLLFSVTADPERNPALADIDLHVYRSDASGTQGVLVGTSESPTTTEGVTVSDSRSVAGGYYLMVVEWFLGAGDYDGKVRLTPRPAP